MNKMKENISRLYQAIREYAKETRDKRKEARRARKYAECRRRAEDEVQLMEWHGKTYLSVGGAPLIESAALADIHSAIRDARMARTGYFFARGEKGGALV